MEHVWTIRPMTARDLPRALELERETLSPWSMTDLQGELARTGGWGFVSCRPPDGLVAGFIRGLRAADEAEILRLTVAGEFRRQGVGGGLLIHALRGLAADAVSACYLEVRQGNPARLLYEKQGFVVNGVRRGYYDGPREDALIMRKMLKEGVSL